MQDKIVIEKIVLSEDIPSLSKLTNVVFNDNLEIIDGNKIDDSDTIIIGYNKNMSNFDKSIENIALIVDDNKNEILETIVEKLDDSCTQINIVDQSSYSNQTNDASLSEIENNGKVEKRKRGPPKAVLENAQKYEAILEKSRLLNKKDKEKKNNKKNNEKLPISTKTIVPDGMRRVIVAGKPKLLKTINANNEIDLSKQTILNEIETNKSTEIASNEIDANNKLTEVVSNEIDLVHKLNEMETLIKLNSNIDTDIEEKDKNIKNKDLLERKTTNKESDNYKQHKNNFPISKTLPSQKKASGKYAMYVSNDIKKHTSKNIRNFKDLRRVDAMETLNLDSDLDIGKASIIELRKLKLEQRKKNAEERKNAEMAQKDSPVQTILKNPTMSKFAKTVAIKNLSVNSRRKRPLKS